MIIQNTINSQAKHFVMWPVQKTRIMHVVPEASVPLPTLNLRVKNVQCSLFHPKGKPRQLLNINRIHIRPTLKGDAHFVFLCFSDDNAATILRSQKLFFFTLRQSQNAIKYYKYTY
jgi:hypothetical protein